MTKKLYDFEREFKKFLAIDEKTTSEQFSLFYLINLNRQLR
jgi:hypothetical protein